MSNITVGLNEVKEYLRYDETSPSCLRWIKNTGRVKSGDVAGALDAKYYRVKFMGQPFLVHRLIFIMHNPTLKLDGLDIDHADGCTTNNRIDNLRAITRQANTQNAKKRVTNTSGVTGVCRQFSNNKGDRYYNYTASVMVNGKLKTKSFSISKYGESTALHLAARWRESSIVKLNAEGSNYTLRHGT